MDFGGSSDNNNNNNKNSLLSSAFDLNPNPKFYGFKPEISLSATAHNHQENYKNMLSFSSPNTPTLPYYALNNTGGYGGGPFTPSQWMELEHQALIYKYMTLNAPIPSNLLIPIKKSLQTAAYYPGINLTNTIWGGFQLGFSNSSDPEPGRCRRTDGKKWRCSRDAVADKKYCERHMNRGRHRSRKPVEGQIGHSVSNGTTTITAAGKVSDSAAVGTTIVSRLHQQNQHRLTSKTQPDTIAIANDNRSFSIKGTMAPSSVSLKQTPPSDFGFVSSLQKNENENQKLQNSLRQFMDDWPHSDKTNLSISIPMASQDFMSTNSSPISETHNFSPLRMGLGMDNTANVFDQRSHQSSWIPVSWDRSMGGPLGEALHHGTNNSGLNLMTDGWESSRQTNLSPTGVLQKTGFGCYSNSSTGSSPRTDNGPHGSTVIGSSWPLL